MTKITNYTYNAADQLTNVTATGVNATYVYNADGKRVKQTLGSTVTNYLWDEASSYGDVVYEYSNTGTALANYVLAGNQLISQTRGTTTKYFLQDGQGNTRGLLSNVANPTVSDITDTYSYTAFGESFATTGTTARMRPYRYTGQQLDTSTGLYSLRARFYNPTLGRFLSQDTYPVNFSNPVELNRYGYTANNPVNAIDPSGHNLVEYAVQGATWGALIGGGSDAALQLYATGSINVWEVLGWALVGSGAGALIGVFVGIATGVVIAETTATAVGVGELACADGDCTNETNALIKIGKDTLESPTAQSLAQKISNAATQNPSARVVSLGSDGFYQKPGFTYFELPLRAWKALNDAGSPYVEIVNRLFMKAQMSLGKEFGFTIDPALNGRMGYYSQMEYDILRVSEKYIEIVKAGFDHYFIPK